MSILAKVKAQRRAALVEPEAPGPAPRPMSPEEVRQHNERAREEVDAFFSGPIMAGLTALYQAGRLPAGGLDCPEWAEVEREWVKAGEDSPLPCDAEKVKRLMADFIQARGGEIPPEAPPRREEVRAIRIRHGRGKRSLS